MSAAPEHGRMAWLDALRAVAVLLVVYAHLTRYVFTDVRAVTGEWLHAGPAGVMLFFLVSGYIIPASLERHGDVRRFWTGRARRLLPLYLAVVVVLLPVAWPADPLRTLTGHATMLPFLLDVPLITPVLWTLSYEMAFYLLVSGLFTAGLRRVEAAVAVLLAGLAVVTAPLTSSLVPLPVAVLVLTAGFAAVYLRRIRLGGIVLGLLAVALLLLNQDPAHAWDGLLIVAVMFTGTTLYRAERGQIRWRQAGLTAAVVAAALLWNWLAELRALDGFTPGYIARSMITLLVVAGTFAVAFRWRHRRVPAWLARTGVLSYSIYLVHYAAIQLLQPWLTADLPDVVVAAGYVAMVLGVSALTYRWIELPAQRRAAPAPAVR
ncbi:acyltransferase family protein [Actinoplanes rectilineatus]|uniref:acyltransferase family protein n=1 Tax=Actinoplanes rectilineatus TaxID=113571 RepID=UPI000698CEB4|nr:acyltransferase [Actinoplanes rectilineatus]